MIAAACGLAGSCSTPADDPRTPSVVLDTIGDTIVARVIEDAPRGAAPSLELDLVIGGSDENEDAIFGQLGPMALLPGGGVAVVDVMGPRVLEYSPRGELVRMYGRKGRGPGEFEDARVAALDSGRLAVADVRNQKVIVFDSRGDVFAEWRFGGQAIVGDPISSGRGGEIILRCASGAPAAASDLPSLLRSTHLSFVAFSALGDTLGVVSAPYHDEAEFAVGFAPFQPKRSVRWHPEGSVVTGRSDTYAIEIFRPDGRVVRIVRDWTTIRLHDDEWDVWNQLRQFVVRRGGRFPIPEIPRGKPAFADILVSRTGEIWVQRHTSSVRVAPQPKDIIAVGGQGAIPWREPLLFDVFTVDGSFLGSVSGPPGVEVGAISGDTVWGARSAAYDIPSVVRYIVAR